MFTGIIQHLGRVASFENNPFGATLCVDSSDWRHRPAIGDSIAVNGCCLTVAERSANGMLRFDVIRQTLDSTALGDLRNGSAVNLEHAVTPQTLLGGHIVQGHIDGVGEVESAVHDASESRLRIRPCVAELMDYIVEKGSIAVQGVSLTIARADRDAFEVALIPTTLRLTNLGELRAGDRVNLETDYLAKIIVNLARR